MVRPYCALVLVAISITAMWLCHPSRGQERRRAEQPARKAAPRNTAVEKKAARVNQDQTPSAKARQRAPDAAADAMVQRDVKSDRPEQQLTNHDRSNIFDFKKPAPLSAAITDQPKSGRMAGFDFARDPLNAPEPFTTFAEVYKKESAAKAGVDAAQRKLLASRYNLKAPSSHRRSSCTTARSSGMSREARSCL